MFNGSLVALITPFKDDRIDEDALRRMVEWQIEQGTHAELVARGGRYAAMYALQQPWTTGPEREHAVSG